MYQSIRAAGLLCQVHGADETALSGGVGASGEFGVVRAPPKFTQGDAGGGASGVKQRTGFHRAPWWMWQ
ncbi:hypothetical protein IU449_06065 [Nocardia higoensis]|uniref:Uncharacterized protein n=1 Tax=Nocardia higoensis TaxID=228599 RepID=A0ABS0D6L0_9NOCA|nr:hypothetical protein [Nocardia higoensis]MBF6354117.1 hypothetical protein [Nocardia higoensis]